jgi:hypothetical protein
VHTIGWGVSGGSMQQHLIAENYPGLLDGITPGLSFPDAISFFTPISDCQLLNHYFDGTSLSWSPAAKLAVEGWGSANQCSTPQSADWGTLVQAGRGPGVPSYTGCSQLTIPQSLIYDPATNPRGVRCDFWDNEVNVFGADPLTGFARRTIDNVGVQYGLNALKAGQISTAQFLSLNQRFGGYDDDGNIVTSRSVADPKALKIAYQTGTMDEGGGGLASVPIIDYRAYYDDGANPHDSVRTQTMLARLAASNGTTANQVNLEAANNNTPMTIAVYDSLQATVLQEMDRWLDNIADDHGPARTELAKIVRDKPSELVDACYTAGGVKVTDPGTCRQMYPVHGNPRMAAGEPISNDYLKCRLAPVRRFDYPAMTDAQFARLRAIFPSGVCDYSRAPVGQKPLKSTWLAYPRPGHSVPLNANDRGNQ